jgi:FkbM family methyltransferase
MQRAYRFVNRPYYLYRPSQLRARLHAGASEQAEPQLMRTAWGAQLYCWDDPVGQAVARTGVYDLVVMETLARLADPGETAVDAGANVGLMSSVLAYATGERGRVVAYEPHPLNFQALERNIERWRETEGIDTVQARQAAVSSQAALLPLAADPDTFARNKGTASLEAGNGDSAVQVRAVRLDEEFDAAVGVLKLDVEMHELAALEGAERLLREGQVRDILFEEHEQPPTAVTELLAERGYTVIGVKQAVSGPVACTPAEAYAGKLWDPPALLATRDPARARARLRRRGWLTLRSRLGARPSQRVA